MLTTKSRHQLIYETMTNDIADVVVITGLYDEAVIYRRNMVLQFLSESPWDEQEYSKYYLKKMDAIHRAQQNPALPGVFGMTKNLIGSVAQHLRAGWVKCDAEQSAARYEVCQLCEKMRDDGRCSLCGCFMELKSTWKEQKCPIGKW